MNRLQKLAVVAVIAGSLLGVGEAHAAIAVVRRLGRGRGWELGGPARLGSIAYT